MESCFFFQDQDGSCKHMSLTVCRSDLQGDGPAVTPCCGIVGGGVKAGMSSCSLGGGELPFLSVPSNPWDHSRAHGFPLRLPGTGCCERHELDFSNQ